MDLNFADETYIIDLSYAASASDIVFELSSIMTNDMAKNQKISLKLGNVDLNQSQLLSIRSLISSINSTVAYLETTSTQTEQAAINLGIVVINTKKAEASEEKATTEPTEPTYVQSYGYVKLEDHLEDEEEEESETVEETKEEQEETTENEEEEAEIEVEEEAETEEKDASDEASEESSTEVSDADSNEKSEENLAISTEEADAHLEAKAEEVQDALSDIYKSEVRLESILESEHAQEEGVVSADVIKHAMLSEQSYTEADFEIDHFSTTYIKQTLRSGQIVNYDGNVVIIGDCHPGSEVIASGDITVWGILSGIAHAGAKGNQRARVRALKMNAIQLRIGKCYARKPDGMNTIFPERTSTFTPEEARVINNEIVIFKIND